MNTMLATVYGDDAKHHHARSPASGELVLSGQKKTIRLSSQGM